LIDEAARLGPKSTSTHIDNVLLQLAACDLGHVGERRVIDEIRRRTKMPVHILAGQLAAMRRDFRAAEDPDPVGRRLGIADIEPWPEPVAGAALLDQISAAVRRYVVLDDTMAHAVALWVVGTHVMLEWTIYPRLLTGAPEKGCGKSTLLDVISRLVPRALTAADVSAPALFRTIEAAHPTLVLDEADTWCRDDEHIRAVLDAGHRCDGAVIRLVEVRAPGGGTDYEPRRYSCYAAVALAAIGWLPGTIEDRSVRIGLRRRRPDEPVERLRLDHCEDLARLARMAARWSVDHTAALRIADPELPDDLANRAADNWRPLVAIADLADGDWPTRARNAAITLTAAGAEERETARTMLLADLRDLFAVESSGVLLTSEILPHLHDRDDRPWPEYRAGKPITPRQIAQLLRPLGVAAGTVRRGATTAKGYRAADLADAWSRYLPPRESVTASQRADSVVFPEKPSATPSPDVTDRVATEPRIPGGCDGVTVSDPLLGVLSPSTRDDDETTTWTA
jgi:putative DNA primase/helicase